MRIDTSFTTPGLSFGEYQCGMGKFILNSYRLNQAVGIHPYADRLLYNAIRYYGQGV